MKNYRPKTPSAAIGAAALALSLATIGIAVIAPARMSFRSAEVPVMSVSTVPAQASGHDSVVAVIDVNAVRAPRLVTVVEPLHASRRG